MKQIIQNLKKQQKDFESEAQDLLKIAKDSQSKYDKAKHQSDSLQKRIQAMEKLASGDIKVSDHAVLRVLERRYGQGEMIEKVREKIIEEIRDRVLDLNCKINLEDGLQAVLEGGCIVTVQPA